MKKITLLLSDGRKMTFSTEELVAIVEEHLSIKAIKQTITSKIAQKPTENEWFEVKPQSINQKLFKEKRKDPKQEKTRQLILEAFSQMENNPRKYGKDFKTLMPKNSWGSKKTVTELKHLACMLGDHNADWVELALEWAQRISNGETWESICNNIDPSQCFRIIVWKDGYCRLTGGSMLFKGYAPVSIISDYSLYDTTALSLTVPLVVSYNA